MVCVSALPCKKVVRNFITSAEGMRLGFYLRLSVSVCLVCLLDYRKRCKWIMMKLFGGVGRGQGNNGLYSGGEPDPDP